MEFQKMKNKFMIAIGRTLIAKCGTKGDEKEAEVAQARQ